MYLKEVTWEPRKSGCGTGLLLSKRGDHPAAEMKRRRVSLPLFILASTNRGEARKQSRFVALWSPPAVSSPTKAGFVHKHPQGSWRVQHPRGTQVV